MTIAAPYRSSVRASFFLHHDRHEAHRRIVRACGRAVTHNEDMSVCAVCGVSWV